MPRLLLVAPLTGALYAFGYPHAWASGHPVAALAAFLAMAALLEKLPRTRERALAALLHQLGFLATGFYWIPYTLQEFGGLPPGVSHLASLALAPVLNPAWWVYVAWQHVRGRLPGQASWTPALHAFMPAALMTAAEYLIPQQFPVYLGHTWGHLGPWLSLADVAGVSLYSFFSWWLVFALLPVFGKGRPEKFALTGVSLFLVAHAVWPYRPWNTRSTHPSSKELSLRVVQANVGNFLKVESESGDPLAVRDVVDRYRALTRLEEPQGLDLIVWPETAYPFPMPSSEMAGADLPPPEIFKELIARTGAEFLVGGYDTSGQGVAFDRFETEYNAAFHFGTAAELKGVYRKHILIPFGETLPFGPFNRPISRVLPALSFFARGTDFPLMRTKHGTGFVVPICYEILQGGFMARMLNAAGGADFIVNLTNDSWYGHTAEPEQHLFLAKWRALEFRRPIVRSTNTGITTVIYPDGREGRRLGVGEKDVLDFRLELPELAPVTIYQRWGLWPLVALWLALSALLSGHWWWQSRRVTGRGAARRP